MITELCTVNSTHCTDASNTGLRYYIWVFVFAQILHGFGCTPLYALGLAFIEDSVPKDSASLYLGECASHCQITIENQVLLKHFMVLQLG